MINYFVGVTAGIVVMSIRGIQLTGLR